jgi:hypothetical protein
MDETDVVTFQMVQRGAFLAVGAVAGKLKTSLELRESTAANPRTFERVHWAIGCSPCPDSGTTDARGPLYVGLRVQGKGGATIRREEHDRIFDLTHESLEIACPGLLWERRSGSTMWAVWAYVDAPDDIDEDRLQTYLSEVVDTALDGLDSVLAVDEWDWHGTVAGARRLESGVRSRSGDDRRLSGPRRDEGCEIDLQCTEQVDGDCSLCGHRYCARHQYSCPEGCKLLVCTACGTTYGSIVASLPAVPAPLATAHAGILAARVATQAIAFERATWIRYLPTHTRFINALPNPITRAHCLEYGALASASPTAGGEALVASQIWGYGRPSGYGPTRTRRAFATSPASNGWSPSQRVQQVALGVGRTGILGALSIMSTGNACALNGVGAPFVTKLLSFVTPRPNRHAAVILDGRVARWMREVLNISLNPNLWSTQQYGEYLLAMYCWSCAIGASAQELELVIFKESARL